MILVTGDVVLDHNFYAGLRPEPASKETAGFIGREEGGGAWLLYRLLAALNQVDRARNRSAASGCGLAFGLDKLSKDSFRSRPGFNFGALWKLHGDPAKEQWWRMEQALGYGAGVPGSYPADPAPWLNEQVPRLLIIDDGGLGFRNHETRHCWPAWLDDEKRPRDLEWILLKMSRPLASGDLWDKLRSEPWRERLITIVSADQLRSEGLRVAGGLSWESSVDDIVDELATNHALRHLELCRHLIVTFRNDAALWLDQPGHGHSAHCELVFDRKLCEGEWEENHRDWKAYGGQSCVTASVAWSVFEGTERRKAGLDPSPAEEIDLTIALAAGLSGTRFLRQHGHGKTAADPRFPFAETARHLILEAQRHRKDASKRTYAAAEVRCVPGVPGIAGGRSGSGKWTILGEVSPWHSSRKPPQVSYEPARRVALSGPDKLPGVPCATFGKLQTFDRYEIDSLRSLRQLMLMYRDRADQKKPLCLAVFGAPGSGKSFGLKQIAKGVFGEASPIKEFNLSQFAERDLIGALHQVRDMVLAGPTPVVFWDEFDSNSHGWLKYFLAPMQDGSFQDGQITHSIGKAVFVFAGGVSEEFHEFETPKDKDDFKLKKGPDFLSRLAGYLNIAGPNPRRTNTGGGPDLEYPVRRAMVIRTALDLGDRDLQIERGLLTALLAAGRYRNGARSLEKLVLYLRDRGGYPLRRAYLPPDEILALHVESAGEFHRLTHKYAAFHSQAESLAPAVHEDWLAGLTAEEHKTNPNAVPWRSLPQDIRDSNIAAALRIPTILELAGLALEEGVGDSTDFDRILEIELENMAEAEHGGWEEQKRIDGWTRSRHRIDEALRHNLLIPYEKLGDTEKELDRRAIRNYPKIVHTAGFRIAVRKQEA
jgi:hypothetical protein